MQAAMRSSTKYALLLGTLGIASSAVSRVSHVAQSLSFLYLLDYIGVALLVSCLLMLFLAREDYPEYHSKYLMLAVILLVSGYVLLYAGMALQNFALTSLRDLGARPGTATFWTGAGMMTVALILVPIARILPLHAMLDRPRRRASMSAFIVSVLSNMFLAMLVISAVLYLTQTLDIIAGKSPYDAQGAISNIQATISAEDIFLVFLIVGDGLFASVYFLAYLYGLGANLGVIEDVFFIYRDGRLIYHGTRRVDATQVDEDILASMLTAVQDFVKDSFSSKLSGSLESMKVGKYDVLLIGGRHSTLAVTSMGVPLRPLKEHLSTILHQVEGAHSTALKSWRGNRENLDACVSDLKGRLKISD
jgi:hypothetical protein